MSGFVLFYRCFLSSYNFHHFSRAFRNFTLFVRAFPLFFLWTLTGFQLGLDLLLVSYLVVVLHNVVGQASDLAHGSKQTESQALVLWGIRGLLWLGLLSRWLLLRIHCVFGLIEHWVEVVGGLGVFLGNLLLVEFLFPFLDLRLELWIRLSLLGVTITILLLLLRSHVLFGLLLKTLEVYKVHL